MSILDIPTFVLIVFMVLLATSVGRLITILLDHTVRRDRTPRLPPPHTLSTAS
jgi:hypothetical protein